MWLLVLSNHTQFSLGEFLRTAEFVYNNIYVCVCIHNTHAHMVVDCSDMLENKGFLLFGGTF